MIYVYVCLALAVLGLCTAAVAYRRGTTSMFTHLILFAALSSGVLAMSIIMYAERPADVLQLHKAVEKTEGTSVHEQVLKQIVSDIDSITNRQIWRWNIEAEDERNGMSDMSSATARQALVDYAKSALGAR